MHLLLIDSVWFCFVRCLRVLLLLFLSVWTCGYIISTLLLRLPRVSLMAQSSCEGKFVLYCWLKYWHSISALQDLHMIIESRYIKRICWFCWQKLHGHTPWRDNAPLMSVLCLNFETLFLNFWISFVLAVDLTPIICCAMYFLLVTAVRLVVGVATHAGLLQVIRYLVLYWWKRYFNASIHSVLFQFVWI